jgi:hypothetical protein
MEALALAAHMALTALHGAKGMVACQHKTPPQHCRSAYTANYRLPLLLQSTALWPILPAEKRPRLRWKHPARGSTCWRLSRVPLRRHFACVPRLWRPTTPADATR